MSIIKIPVSKAGVTHVVEIDTDKVPEELFQYIWAKGCQSVLGRGMSKVTKATPNAEAEVKTRVEANVAALYEGKVRMTGGVKQKGPSKSAEMTEALRQAKITVRDQIKAAGEKVSHYAASEITKAAKELVEADPSYLEAAKKVLAERAQAKPAAKIDVSKMAKSAKKVADAEAKKAKPKAEGQLSAKQAGKAKPKVAPAKGQKAEQRPHA